MHILRLAGAFVVAVVFGVGVGVFDAGDGRAHARLGLIIVAAFVLVHRGAGQRRGVSETTDSAN